MSETIMITITQHLKKCFSAALTELNMLQDNCIILVESSKPEFGDYQFNGVMALAKTLKQDPRKLANQIVTVVTPKLVGVVAKLEIAGPGFINIFLDNNYLAQYISQLNQRNKFGLDFLKIKSEVIVVDLSSPNLAKEMHVGHLRSTVIGDSLARILSYLGHEVICQNHVGDWGTQFGMLIAYLLDEKIDLQQNSEDSTIKINDLEKFYQKAKQKFEDSQEFAVKAREIVVLLQSLDPQILSYWETFKKESLGHCKNVYDLLNLKEDLTSTAVVRGESFYSELLNTVIADLKNKNLVTLSEGALCVFFAKNELNTNEDTPFILQKKDGGYLYSTTDLAAIKYRVSQLNATRIIYVVDQRQALHFKQLFLLSQKLGYSSNVNLVHSAFGTMMNESGKPFKTREGGTVKLIDLIHEANKRAYDLVASRNINWDDTKKNNLAQILAIDAIKYADLSKNRNSDYIFNFDKMLSFEGNTAPYMLYAYTRIHSLLDKANTEIKDTTLVVIKENIEHKLALHIAKFADIVKIAAAECMPHYICQYVYDLAGIFMQFYEACPVLKEEDSIKNSRLKLASLTAAIIEICLTNLLGIIVVKEM
jgi:arginyl-tRNA synthetase